MSHDHPEARDAYLTIAVSRCSPLVLPARSELGDHDHPLNRRQDARSELVQMVLVVLERRQPVGCLKMFRESSGMRTDPPAQAALSNVDFPSSR